MKVLQRILKNTGMLFSTQIVVFPSNLFYTGHIRPYLEPDSFGILSFELFTFLIFVIFANLDLKILSRLKSKYNSQKEVWTLENNLMTFNTYGEYE